MGREAKLEVDNGATRAEARVHLDSEQLTIGPPFRLKIPLRDVTRAVPAPAGLSVASAVCSVVLSMGEKEAAAWAKSILSPPSLAAKLGLKPGLTVATLGPLPREIAVELDHCESRAMKAGENFTEPLAVVAVPEGLPLDALPKLARAMPERGAVWLIYAKGGPINSDELIHAARAAGLKDTKIAKISARHAALRFIAATSKTP